MDSTRHAWLARIGAEFAIIVVGVIIALAFDEWRQVQNELLEERRYYERLARDLDGDISSWTTLLDYMRDKDAALERLERWLDDELAEADYPPGAIAADLAGAANYSGSIPPARLSTYQELLSTGKIALLRNEKFRVQLLDYYFQIENGLTRIDSRTSGYSDVAFRLVPRTMEQTEDQFARRDLSEEELRSIVVKARSEDLKPLLIGERNRVLFLKAIVMRFLESARSLHEFALAEAGA